MSKPYCDFEASKLRLIERVRVINESKYNPTEDKKELEKLAQHLDKTAEILNGVKWIYLQAEVEKDPPPEIGVDGWPIEPVESNLGIFAGAIWRLSRIAMAARAEATALPNPRKKHALPYAARTLLHLMYECEMGFPSHYEHAPGNLILVEICAAAKMPKEPGTCLHELKKAMEEFHPHMDPPGFGNIIVIKQ
jgi:hypothetical protein